MVEATERHAAEASPVVRWADIGIVEVEVARVGRIRVRATRPIEGVATGVVQATILVDIPATHKEQRSSSKCSIDGLRATNGRCSAGKRRASVYEV